MQDRDRLDTFISIAVVLGVIIILGLLVSSSEKDYAEKNRKLEIFVNECLKKGRRVDSIGNGLFSGQVVCNPVK